MISPSVSTHEILKYAQVPKSTWYSVATRKAQGSKEDKRGSNSGRRPPGYTVNRDGVCVLDRTILKALENYREQPFFQNGGGYIKLTHYLRRDHGYYINRKKIYRICRENGLILPRKKKSKLPWRVVAAANRLITAPNQLWEFDIKYGYVHGEFRFFFILSFVDVFSRLVTGAYVGSSCKSGDLRATLSAAIKGAEIEHGAMLVIRSDNGPQMSSKAFHEYLK